MKEEGGGRESPVSEGKWIQTSSNERHVSTKSSDEKKKGSPLLNNSCTTTTPTTINSAQEKKKKRGVSYYVHIYIYNNEPGVLKTTLGCFLHMSALYLHPPKPIDFSFFFFLFRVFDSALAVYLVALLISYS